MAINLTAQLMNEFRGDTLDRVASSLSESPAKTATALSAALPALLGALATRASTTEGASDLLDLIRRNKLDLSQYPDTSAFTAPDGINSVLNAGRPLLDAVLGTRANSVIDWIASFAGINRNSAMSLLSIGLPMVIGRISRMVGSAGLTPSSLKNLIADQRTFLQHAPAGLTTALGINGLGRAPAVGSYDNSRIAASHAAPAAPTYDAENRVQERGAGGWWKWAVPLVLLALIPLFFLLRRPSPAETVRAPATPRAEVPTTGTGAPGVAARLGDFVERRLPRGTTLRLPAAGVESKLIEFIESPAARVDKETWFSFDRLEFETDSAALRPSSQEQVRNVAEILKSYPQVAVKIGGYTDTVGDDAYNLKLSADRANNTMNAIANLGVDRSRLEAQGYGEAHPIADNATAEGRQRNRRIDIRVTRK